MVALALHFQEMVRPGEIRDYADLARLGGVTRERISQIMKLVWLAPDIQQELLYLPPVASGMLADQVLVRHAEGLLRGFLVLRDVDDKILAAGEISQVASGNRVTGNLSLHFKDGSVHEETTVFSQRRAFQLITYHLVQKGKSFKHSTDLSLNASTGQVTVISTDDEGKEKTYSQQMKLPPDVANGLFTTLLKDIDPKTVETTVSMVAATPKPRLVKLKMDAGGN